VTLVALPEVGQPAPAWTAPDADGNPISLGDFGDRWLVFYFYPKDNTPGCTTEATDFTRLGDAFAELNAAIVGISPDSCKSHVKFRDKHDLSIILLSDEDHQIAETYGVWQLKKFMGREFMGVVRSTFLIAPDGTIAAVWSPARPKGHAEAVLDALKTKQS